MELEFLSGQSKIVLMKNYYLYFIVILVSFCKKKKKKDIVDNNHIEPFCDFYNKKSLFKICF